MLILVEFAVFVMYWGSLIIRIYVLPVNSARTTTEVPVIRKTDITIIVIR